MRKLRSDAKWDRREVFAQSLRVADPKFHRIPDWHNREGWRGEPLRCNIHVYAGTDTVFGNSSGVTLPEEVVTPCGVRYLGRVRPVARAEGITSQLEILNECRMNDPSLGYDLPLEHARKIGSPCKVCFPDGWPE